MHFKWKKVYKTLFSVVLVEYILCPLVFLHSNGMEMFLPQAFSQHTLPSRPSQTAGGHSWPMAPMPLISVNIHDQSVTANEYSDCVNRKRSRFIFFFILDSLEGWNTNISLLPPMYQLLSRVQLYATPQTVVLLSMGFPRQKYRNGLPCPSPGKLPDPGIKPGSPELQADSLPSEPPRIQKMKCSLLLKLRQLTFFAGMVKRMDVVSC